MSNYKSVVFLSMALSALAFAIFLPILAPLTRALGLSESQGGAIVSVGSVAMALAGPFWGRVSDRIGRKQVITLGFLGLGLSYACYTWITWDGLQSGAGGLVLFGGLLLARLAVGVFLPAISVAAQALMADNTDEAGRSSGMALIGAASGLGLIVGPVIGGVLALYGLIWPLVCTSVVCLLAFVIISLRVPSDRPAVPVAPERAKLPLKGVRIWLLVVFLTMSAIFTVQITAGFYIQDSLHLSNAETGPKLALALTCVGVAVVGTQVLQMKWLHWSPERLVITGAVLWVAGFAVLLAGSTLELYLGAFLILGVSSGLLMPGYLSGVSLAVGAEKQGAVAGLVATAQGGAGIIAPFSSTFLYQIRPELPFVLVMLAMVALALWFAFAPGLRHSVA